MSDGAYAGLRRAARASSADPDTTEDQPENEEEEDASAGEDRKDDEMTDKTTSASDDAIAAARAEGKAEGFAEANERAASVMASEHYEGREKLAASLLGHASLGADDIIKSLEAADAAPAPEASDDDDGKARAEMRDNLTKEQPASTASEGEDETKAEDTSLIDNMKARFGEAK